ncbi:enoyl-CoA hydratase [Gulbenkiania mobilis]|uniref:enoyl-CoA hydratase n=1 Tax=Gulbenkiania mobilis TaxID=397457 RepID=UPI0006BBD293|nr:enoyl-CoA hydratase [Gulbenkiania mobilis]
MTTQLAVERLGKSAIVALNNPPANLWTPEALQRFAETLRSLTEEDAVRSVVLTGAGESFFSAGADLRHLENASRQEAEAFLEAFQAAHRALRSFRGVTVAAVNGFALGAGLEWALACDYIVAERGAQLGFPEGRVGLVPAAGGTHLLPRRVGVAWAKRMILGGEMVRAERALAIGLIEELVEPGFSKIVALSLANKVAQQAPAAVATARRLIEDSPLHSLEKHLSAEREAVLSLMGQAEAREGIRAFLDKRNPAWNPEEDD